MFPNTEYSILSVLPDMYKDLLIKSRKLFEHVIYGRNNVSALSMYNGYEYQVLEKLLIHSLFLKGKIDFIIISAGYGLVHAFERIRKYEARMDRSNTVKWLKLGLHKVLASYIESVGPREVYGFFSRTSGYNTIFRRAIDEITRRRDIEIHVINPYNCKGIINIMSSLGRSINYLLKYNEIPYQIGPCKIGDTIIEPRSFMF